MIELYTVSDSSRFTYNNETKRKGENQGTEFSELMRNTDAEPAGSQPLNSAYEEKPDELVKVSDMEMVTYTFLGKISLFGKFTGRNINFEV